ncbi:hypothetical protein [Parapedobacter tibetensis]|uniref:hypothetical protein n=1 Tax=Parapedobacter tibetensis TaxID=2972951 RepID=UPI00214D3EA9|nr:hypothetical protein [Parapedobacter tibetensis]
MFMGKGGLFADKFDMVCHDFPYEFIKFCFTALSRTNCMFHVIMVVRFLFFIANVVQSVEEMVVIVKVPKPYRATDVVSVFSSAERSVYLEIGIPHGNHF